MMEIRDLYDLMQPDPLKKLNGYNPKIHHFDHLRQVKERELFEYSTYAKKRQAAPRIKTG